MIKNVVKILELLGDRLEVCVSVSGCGSAISSAKEGKTGFINNLVKS